MKHRSDAARSVDGARSAALEILCAFDAGKGALEQIFQGAAADLDSRDRRFARQLVHGVVKWRARLDWSANQFTRQPVEKLPRDVRNLLRLGLFQLLWLDRVPARAAVHTAVALAKSRRRGNLAGMVNAVLRRASTEAASLPLPDRAGDPVGYLALAHSHPPWLVERWLQRWGDCETEALLEANNRPPPLFARIDARRPGDLAAQLPQGAFHPDPVPDFEGCFRIREAEGLFDTPAFRAGLFWIQDVNAGIAASLLDSKPGERVLDACSAPGGKAVQIALAMRGRGLLVAADSAPSRLRFVAETCRRMRLESVAIVAQDAAEPSFVPGTLGPGGFDRVLLDVPCSSTGVLARLPEARWRRRPGDLKGYSARQLDILRAGYEVLKLGGVLVYSTCSLEPEENEQVVAAFLEQTPNAALEPAHRFFRAPWAAAYVQTVPGREVGDGAFAARIRKKPVPIG